jgi:hypothetical protein
MATESGLPKGLFAAILALLIGALTYQLDIGRAVTVIGLFRKPASTVLAPEDFVAIDGTMHCEDLHYYAPSNQLFTACEGSEETRYSWFPPLANFDNPSATQEARGSIHVIDPTVRVSCLLSSCFVLGGVRLV